MRELKLVAYMRVSTQKQGRSGLGLEAQKADIENFARTRGGRIAAQFTEIESGKISDRGELIKAIRHAKIPGARLVIAKLDRLSRSASFTLTLRDSGVKFVCCDNAGS
ncbi:recombinase family protein [Bradyrhizobium japonicum]|uniref:recombinase family protein n=1 Tax=Bradyrhizobium japonicum TaxID=375 RepID=UPI00192CC2C1|nr:recombinase family protein [Bradyrhizobium japonicum]